jgi:phosphate:Na+ symporter
MFNVTNTLILIWFIPQIEKFVSKLIPQKATDEGFKLQYIQVGIMKTPEIAVFQAQKETELFAERMRGMFAEVRELYSIMDNDAFEKKALRIKEMEEMSDRLESEIGGYLAQVGDAHLSDDTKRKVRSLLREVSELESIGDSLFNLSRTMERKHSQKAVFIASQEQGIADMFGLLDGAMGSMEAVLKGTGDYEESQDFENRIDALRNVLRAQNTADVDDNVYSFAVGTIFIDLIRECEKCGDYVMNVVEAKLGKRDNAPETGSLHIDTVQKTASVNGQVLDLNKAEFEMLSLFVSNPGRVFSPEELRELVWPKDVPGEHSVEVAIREIRSKLGTLSEHIRTRAGYGFYYE